MATGINVSKANIYGVLTPSEGISVSKAVAYAVIQPLDPGINVSKALIYAVLQSAEIPSLTGGLSDSLLAVVDGITAVLLRHRTASLSDALRPPSDLLFPPPIDAVHFTGTVADLLRVISDHPAAHVNRALAGNIADRIQVIRDAISAGTINLETPVRWVAPVAITPRVSTIDPIYLAAHPVRHPDRFYEGRVKSYGTFTRSISAPVGFIRTGDAALTVLDPDNSVRQRMAPKTIRKAKAEVRLGPEGASLGAFLRPLIREVGTVGQPGDGELTIPLRDYLFDKLDEKTAGTWTPDSANFADAILSVLVEAMGIEESLDRINFASFDETRTRVADLICSGTLTESITYGELLTRLQRSSNIDIFADKNDRIAIHYTTDDEAPTVNLDDILRLYKGTVSQQLAEPTFNRLPYKYNRQVAEDGTETWTEGTPYDLLADQEALGEIVEDEPLQMYFVADAATALKVIERRAQYLDLDSFRFEAEIPLIPVLEQLELADLVAITHFGGIKSGGYVGEQFKVLELSMDVDSLKYHLKGIRRRLPPPGLVETEAGGVAGISGTARINSRVGPYATDVEGELFAVFLEQSILKTLRVWHSDDYGATWALIDDANAPTLANVVASFDSYVADGIIHIATQEQSTGRVAYHTFSMTDQVWATINEQVVASVANSGMHCVSIETRYPAGEPVVYFQGDRVLKTGIYWQRGYYSIKQGGAWSVPVVVTPDPGTYPENTEWSWHADAISSNCYVQRVVAGRENRMHFFYSINPSVVWIQWSPDEYAVTMQGNFTFSGRNFLALTGVYYPAARNVGDPCINAARDKIAFVRKGGWGSAFVDVYSEGPSLIALGHTQTSGTLYNSYITDNPSGYVREIDGILYLVQNTSALFVSLQESSDDGVIWSDALRTSPQYAYPTALYTLSGTVLKIRGRLYLAYFTDPGYPAYRWIKVDSLPYTP